VGLGSLAAEADPSSNIKVSSSNAGPSNAQAGPSSNAAPAGRTSSFAQSTTGSDDSWDDMDCDEKCVDYLCFGPRENREKFRPWKKKSREVIEAEKQAKKQKRKGKARRHQTTNAANSQNAVAHPPHHLDPKRDGNETVSPASPATDDADLRRVNLHLQAQVEQLRRQLDDSKRKARAERDRLDKTMEELPYSGHESGQPQERQLVPTGMDKPRYHPLNCSHDRLRWDSFTQLGSSNPNAGPSSHAEPSRSTSHDDPSTHPHGPSTSSNVPLEGGPSSSTPFFLASIHIEEKAMKEKRTEDALSRPTSKATHSQSTVHVSHHHDSQRDDITMTSAASPAADELNLQRAVLQLQGQVEELRRRFDDPKRQAEKEGLEKNVYSGQESDEPHPRAHTGTPYPITTHCTQAVTNDANYSSRKSGSPSGVAGASSRSDHGPSTLQAGPSTSSNAPPESHLSSSMQFNSDSVQAEERVNEQRRETTLSNPTSHATPSQTAVHGPHHNDARMYDIGMGSTAYTTADDGDLQRFNLQLQEQNEQLRRRLDDMERRAEVERYMLEKELAELRSRGHESQKPQAHHLPPGTSSPHRLLHPGHH
jgi:hypothetical protein